MYAIRKSAKAIAVLGMTMAMAAVCSAGVLIGDFETAALDGWQTDGGPGSPTLAQSAIGVTHGSFSLKSTTAQGGFWGPATGNLITVHRADLMNAITLSLDLTMNSADLNGGSGNFDGFAQSNELAVTLFSPSTGSNINAFIQKNWTAAGVSDSKNHSAQWAGDNGTRTLVWDLTKFTFVDPADSVSKTVSQLLAAHADISDAKIAFVEQFGGASAPAGPGSIYFDNVQLNPVPEPMSLATLGIGAAALLRRRSRR